MLHHSCEGIYLSMKFYLPCVLCYWWKRSRARISQSFITWQISTGPANWNWNINQLLVFWSSLLKFMLPERISAHLSSSFWAHFFNCFCLHTILNFEGTRAQYFASDHVELQFPEYFLALCEELRLLCALLYSAASFKAFYLCWLRIPSLLF